MHCTFANIATLLKFLGLKTEIIFNRRHTVLGKIKRGELINVNLIDYIFYDRNNQGFSKLCKVGNAEKMVFTKKVK